MSVTVLEPVVLDPAEHFDLTRRVARTWWLANRSYAEMAGDISEAEGEALAALVVLCRQFKADPDGLDSGEYAKAWLTISLRRRLHDWARRIVGKSQRNRASRLPILTAGHLDQALSHDTTATLADVVECSASARSFELVELRASFNEDRARGRWSRRDLTFLQLVLDGCTMREIGDALGVTESRACRLAAGLGVARRDIR